MNMPDPAAHLSLLLKTRTLPASVMPMARVHCAPMSSTVFAVGNKKCAARAALVISVN